MSRVQRLALSLREDGGRAQDHLQGFADEGSFPRVQDNQATFFFWDGKGAEEVTLIHWVFGLESRQAFERLPGSDAFILQLELPTAARVEYKLELVRGGQRHWIRDPRNPLQARDPFGANSVIQMPGYEAPGWIHPLPESQGGELELHVIRSEIWGGPRRIAVYLPFEYRANKRLPLVICHDGTDTLRFASAREVLDNLIRRHEVKPLIVAFVDPGETRNEEYAANPLQARFLVEEVLPFLERTYAIRPDPAERGLMGASFGAVSALHTAWSYPGVFGRLMLQSGSFAFTDIGTHDRGPLWDPVVSFVNAFRADPGRVDARMFLSCGCFESLIYYNRSLVPLLRAAGLQVRFVESLDGHNWISWRDRMRDGLTWLFPGHLWMYYE